ncbi:DUF4179 domain-containing protein [Bacillus ndiopicus]|uniref:DUF4179 domain-containing protein n=1 Tax=Bacillus ndiopicus TaxID=1347368 RepID=UPI0005A897C4|nr:DUF4179 domain-containing protein [Bacillus ndiopicus]
MNDYKQFANLNIDEIEPVAVTELEKKRLQKHVLGHKKKRAAWRKYAIIAAILFGGTVVTPFTFPSLAAQIPFMKNIVEYTNTQLIYKNYNDLATVLEQVQSSDGISIMIENAVFDGTSMTLTYAIETDKNLGEQPFIKGSFNVKSASGYGGTGFIKKINDNTYIGVESITPLFDDDAPEEILVRWQPSAIRANSEVIYKGDWSFEFKLPKLQNAIKTVHVEQQLAGVQVVINAIEQNALSTIIRYTEQIEKSVLEEWPMTSVDIIEVRDNLGNVYEAKSNGGHGNLETGTMEWSFSIDQLPAEATTLFLTPRIFYSKGSGNNMQGPKMQEMAIDLR